MFFLVNMFEKLIGVIGLMFSRLIISRLFGFVFLMWKGLVSGWVWVRLMFLMLEILLVFWICVLRKFSDLIRMDLFGLIEVRNGRFGC